MAMSCKPSVLIADEPTSDLDIEATKEVMELLKKINEKGTRISAEHIKKVKQMINKKCEQ